MASGGRFSHLPNIWVTEVERDEDGVIQEYFINLRTRMKFYNKEDLYRYFRDTMPTAQTVMLEVRDQKLSEEQRDDRCCRCKEPGHNCLSCPYPIIYKMNPFEMPSVPLPREKRVYRCSRCNQQGHNVRTCPR